MRPPRASTTKTWLKALLHDYRSLPTRLFSVLALTVKTHKPVGQVTCRALHGSSRHPMLPGMRWVAWKCRRALQGLPRLHTNTEQLQRQLWALVLPQGCVLCKLDITVFYMSGEHGLLITECTRHIVEDRAQFRALLSSIVRNQYVCLSDDFDAHPFVYRVRRGTGMGLCCSGEVADLVFYSTVEEPFVLRPDIQREYGIVYYGRFRDDILCISSQPDRLHEMLQRMQALSRCFDLTIDCIDPLRTIMLDLSLWFCARGGNAAVEYAVHVKPTSVWVPLCDSSAHPPHVHINWPKGYESRLRRRCTYRRTADSQVAASRERLRKFCPSNIHLQDSRTPSSMALSRPRPRVSPSRLIVPYRFDWAFARIPRAIRCAYDRWRPDDHLKLHFTMCPQISWRLGGRHLARTLTKHQLDDADGTCLYQVFRRC